MNGSKEGRGEREPGVMGSALGSLDASEQVAKLEKARDA